MIMDTLEHAKQYKALSEGLGKALCLLEQTVWRQKPPEACELEDGIRLLVQTYDTKPPERGTWEAHRAYIDIQYMLEGDEQIGYAPIDRLMPDGDYVAEQDFQGFTGEGNLLHVRKNSFCIFFPQDAHMPCLDTHAHAVKKLILKVPVDL